MKAAFIHDHYFVYNQNDGRVYDGSGGVFDERLWKRYLAVFDSLIVVGRQKDDLPNKLVCSECEHVSFELNSDLISGMARYTKKQIIKEKLRKTLEKVDFAIIRLPSVLGYIAQEICIEQKKKYVLEIVTCPWDAYWNYGNIAGKLVAPLEFLKLKGATKKAQDVIYVTKHFLQNRYPTFHRQIAISNVLIKSRKNWEDVVRFYENGQPEIFKIGLIGSFHVRWKGHYEAIKAVAKLVQQGVKNVKLFLVGTGDYGWVEDIIATENVSEYVEIIGTLEAAEKGIYPFMDGLHLYIHPSKQEGLPRVVIEALSRGRLTLGSSAAGIPELLDEEYLHKPGDWNTLADQIASLYNNPDSWERICKVNWDRSLEYFEDRLQKKREEFLKDALK